MCTRASSRRRCSLALPLNPGLPALASAPSRCWAWQVPAEPCPVLHPLDHCCRFLSPATCSASAGARTPVQERRPQQRSSLAGQWHQPCAGAAAPAIGPVKPVFNTGPVTIPSAPAACISAGQQQQTPTCAHFRAGHHRTSQAEKTLCQRRVEHAVRRAVLCRPRRCRGAAGVAGLRGGSRFPTRLPGQVPVQQVVRRRGVCRHRRLAACRLGFTELSQPRPAGGKATLVFRGICRQSTARSAASVGNPFGCTMRYLLSAPGIILLGSAREIEPPSVSFTTRARQPMDLLLLKSSTAGAADTYSS